MSTNDAGNNNDVQMTNMGNQTQRSNTKTNKSSRNEEKDENTTVHVYVLLVSTTNCFKSKATKSPANK